MTTRGGCPRREKRQRCPLAGGCRKFVFLTPAPVRSAREPWGTCCRPRPGEHEGGMLGSGGEGWDGESRVPSNGATGGSCVCSAPAQRLPRPVRGTRSCPGPAQPILSLLSGQQDGFHLGKGVVSPGTAAIAGPQRSRGRGKGRARVGARSSVSSETAHRCPRWSGPDCPESRVEAGPPPFPVVGVPLAPAADRGHSGPEPGKRHGRAPSLLHPRGFDSQPGLRRGGQDVAVESVGG